MHMVQNFAGKIKLPLALIRSSKQCSTQKILSIFSALNRRSAMHPYCILFSISLSLLSSAIKGVVHCNYIGCNRYSYKLCLIYMTQIDCLRLLSIDFCLNSTQVVVSLFFNERISIVYETKDVLQYNYFTIHRKYTCHQNYSYIFCPVSYRNFAINFINLDTCIPFELI